MDFEIYNKRANASLSATFNFWILISPNSIGCSYKCRKKIVCYSIFIDSLDFATANFAHFWHIRKAVSDPLLLLGIRLCSPNILIDTFPSWRSLHSVKQAHFLLIYQVLALKHLNHLLATLPQHRLSVEGEEVVMVNA